ncbi:MAG: mechanosensitive ion channel family protein [Syntrophales bacterium]
MRYIRTLLVILLFIFLSAASFAAEKAAPAPAAKGTMQAEATYDDPLGRSTPQGTVVGFLKAMQKEDYVRAVDYLDTRQTGKRARQLSLELHQVLDRGLNVSATALSSKPEGKLNEGLPFQHELVGVVKTKRGEYKILLERVQKENNPLIWLFSSETLNLIPRIYEEIDVPWLERQLPEVLTETRLAGVPLYQWVAPVLLLPLAFLFGWLCTALFFALMRKRLRRHLDEQALIKIGKIKNPLVLLFSVSAIYLFSLGAVSMLGRMFWTFVASTAAVIGLTWTVIHLIEIGAEIIERRRPEASNAVIRLSATLLKASIVVVGLVVVFYYFAGINLTAVIAGLGVGSIAVAFAAQKTIENFLGGVFLVWDKPIRLGDFCKAGEHQGTVEHIGLRSTQIRTLNRTMVSIPNGQLSSISVENFTLRDRFLFRHTLNLRYETTADQLRYILVQLRELLYRHPRVDSASAYVRFIDFGQSSLDVEIFAYVVETAQGPYLAVMEDLLLRIMDIVESAGSGFAFPSQTLYMAKEKGLDDNKGREAAKAVQRWREQGELPFPDHLPETVHQLDGTLDYPPKGSFI